MRTAGALAVVCSVGVALRPVTPPRVRASARARVAPVSPESPELPPATEDGGVLSRILPLSLLLESQEADRSADLRVGEDAATFAWRNERWGEAALLPAEVTGAVSAGRDWTQFFVAVGAILSALAVLWVYSPTGYGDDFVAALERACGGNSHLVTLCFGVLFPLVHSGLASLRPWAREFTGERLWRVIFASASLPLAYSWIVYYIAHVHDGVEFWNLQANPAAHAAAWCDKFASFFAHRSRLPRPLAALFLTRNCRPLPVRCSSGASTSRRSSSSTRPSST